MNTFMKTFAGVLALSAILALGTAAPMAQAGVIYQDDFSSDPGIPGVVWDDNTGTPASYDGTNQEVDYTHTAGTSRRFQNHNTGLFNSTEGYFKATISNFTGSPSIWMAFIEDNSANNANYASTVVSGNGTIEMVVNNSGSSISFNNGAGWSGTLLANSGLVTTNGGTTTAALTFGSAVDSGTNLKGFGFANFGNATVFPSSSFSIDNVVVSDTAVVIPEPATFVLLGLGIVGVMATRRRL